MFIKKTDEYNKLYAYIKASNTSETDEFGSSVDTTFDGKSLVVGAIGENNNSRTINSYTEQLTAKNSGAVYLY